MKRFFTTLFLFSARSRKWLWAGVFLLTCLAAWSVVKNHYSTDMRKLLREDSCSYRNLDTVINSGLANRVTLYFSRKDGGQLDNPADMRAIQMLAVSLKDIKGVDQVVCTLASSSQKELYCDFVQYFPLLYPPSRLPGGRELDSCFRRGFKALCLNPIGGGVSCRYDPFFWTGAYLLKLEETLKISGLQFYAGNSAFIISPDRKVCMVLLYTDVLASDYKKSVTLIKELEEKTKKLSPHLQCDFFSPHIHMLENAKIMKTDLRVFAVCTFLLFVALFAFIYKWDWRGMVIPMLAALGSFWAAAVMGRLFDPVLLFTLAMGGVLIGIAGDYGIHFYAVSFSRRKVQDGIALIPKLLLAFLTTSTAFLGFVFSGVPAFVQFGAYSVLTLAFSFLLLLFLLPGLLFFRKGKRKLLDFYQLLHLEKISFRHAWWALLVLIVFACGVFADRFDTDIRKFDVAYESSAEKESLYQRAFAKKDFPAILLYTASTYDDLLVKCRKDKEKLMSLFPGIKMISPADFFLPPSEQKKNLQQWKEFMASGRWEGYKKDFLKRAARFDFSEEFFAPFLGKIEKGIHSPPQKMADMLSFTGKSMISSSAAHWTGAAMVDKKSISNEDLQKNTSAIVFSEEIFSKQLFRDILGDLPLVIPWVLLLVFTSIFVNLRSLTKSFLAFLPVAACLVGIAGIHGFLGQEITLAVVVAGIITVGISVDYGLLLVNSDMERHIFNSITFSAITTAAGGMTVFFTHHPMLRAAGLTIVTGILFSCFFSFCLLYPVLKMIREGKWKKSAGVLSCLIICMISGACSSLPEKEVLPLLPVPEGRKCCFPAAKEREFQGSLLMDYKTGQVSFLIAGKISLDGKGEFYGFSPGGIKLFSLYGRGYKLERSQWMKSIVSGEKEKVLSRFLYGAVAAGGYVPASPRKILDGRSRRDTPILTGYFSSGGSLSCYYAGEKGRIVRKEYREKDLSWLLQYCRKQPGSDFAYLFSDRSFFRAYVKMSFYE